MASGERNDLLRNRIVGGSNVREAVPWIAYLQLQEDNVADFCTGSLVNALFVVSAAHCACLRTLADEPCE